MRIAINGLGRIGRTVLRQIASQPEHADIDVVAINDIASKDTCAYLLRYDSVFGGFPGQITETSDGLKIRDRHIRFSRTPDLAGVDLSGVDVLMDCTGKAKTRDFAELGLRAGAARVLVSGPSPAVDATVVLGANDAELADHSILSNASCTTHALAPLLRALDTAAGLRAAHMTTIHCYTGSQPMIDAPRDNLARSRAGALSMVPTTTSATHQVNLVLPDLAGRITGAAVRVPVASVSAIDVVATLTNLPSGPVGAFLNDIAAASDVIDAVEDPLVSSDLRANPASLILALPEALRVAPDQIRIFGWYDNEWGFSARMIDTARRMAA